MPTYADYIDIASDTASTDITREILNVSHRPVGHGGYSDIYTGVWHSSIYGDLKVALKVVRTTPNNPGIEKIRRRLKKEIFVWKGLVHLNIQSLSGICTSVGHLPALVSPWCKNGDINSFLQRLKLDPHVNPGMLEMMKLDLLSGVTTGLQFLHDNHIVHGDIKGGNVLISDDRVPLLCDVGLSRIIAEHSESMTQTGMMGTFRWMAPELLLEDGTKPSYESDVWACGCLFIEVWSGVQPYHTKTTLTQVIKALSQHEGPACPPEIPDFIWRRVQKCCSFDASLRPPPSRLAKFLAEGTLSSPAVLRFDRSPLSVAWLPGGNSVVVGCQSGSVQVLDVRSGAALHRLAGNAGEINDVTVSPNGRLVALGCDDSSIRLWDAERGVAFGTPMNGHMDSVWAVAFSPDGRRIVSGSSDNTIRVWSAETGATVPRPLCRHSGSVYCVAYSSDGSRIISGSWDRTIRVWDARTGDLILTLRGHTDMVRSVAYSPDDSRIVSGSEDRTIRIWNAVTGCPVGDPLEGHYGLVWCVAYSPDGKHIASGSRDSTIRVWESATGGCMTVLRGHTDAVVSVAFSPDGRQLASASVDGSARMWEAPDEWMRWDV